MENLLHIIKTHRKALEIYTRKEFPIEWAEIQIKIAKSYIELAEDQDDDNEIVKILKFSIESLESAKGVYFASEYPIENAISIRRIGELCLEISTMLEDKTILKNACIMAVDCFRGVLSYFTEHDFPTEWAELQKKLSEAYAVYPYPEDDIEWRHRQVIVHLRESLRIYTKQKYPEKFAEIQTEIGHLLNNAGYLISALQAYSLAIWAYRSMDDETADDIDRIRKNVINAIYSDDYEFIKKATSKPPPPSSF